MFVSKENFKNILGKVSIKRRNKKRNIVVGKKRNKEKKTKRKRYSDGSQLPSER